MTPEQLKIFYKLLETKNLWGKNEIKQVILEVITGVWIEPEPAGIGYRCSTIATSPTTYVRSET